MSVNRRASRGYPAGHQLGAGLLSVSPLGRGSGESESESRGREEVLRVGADESRSRHHPELPTLGGERLAAIIGVKTPRRCPGGDRRFFLSPSSGPPLRRRDDGETKNETAKSRV